MLTADRINRVGCEPTWRENNHPSDIGFHLSSFSAPSRCTCAIRPPIKTAWIFLSERATDAKGQLADFTNIARRNVKVVKAFLNRAIENVRFNDTLC